MKPMRLLIFGPPGCGKGTLSGIIHNKTHLTHISVGEMIREHIKAHDEIGTQAEAIVSKGGLIPDDITNQMVQERLAQDDAKESFLLDGYPRDLEQAQFLTGIAQITGVIEMTLTDEMILERLMKRGRADDNEETIKNRIALYKETTQPILDYFREQNIPLIQIDGDYDIETEVDSYIERIMIWQETVA